VLTIGKTLESVDNAPENLNPDGRDLIVFLKASLAFLWKDWPKNMRLNVLDPNAMRYSLSGVCPHCGRDSVFTRVTDPYQRNLEYQVNQLAAVMECQGCLKYVLSVVRINHETWEFIVHYPLGNPDDSVDQAVPISIAADFSEALRCFFIQSYKACVAMCRRSVEASCQDLGATGGNLKERINSLFKSGRITEPLKDMAHKVRLTANEELHGQPDDLDAFTEPEAKDIVEFTREYFHHVYVMPEKLANSGKPKASPEKSTH